MILFLSEFSGIFTVYEISLNEKGKLMAENTPIEEKSREESFTESPKAVNRVTLIATLIIGIIVIIGIIFISGLFSETDERGNNSNESLIQP